MTKANIKHFCKNNFFKLIFLMITIIGIFATYLGLKIVLNTEHPITFISCQDMCMFKHCCDGWSHPFEPTLHIGDLVIVQGINPKEIKAAPYPNGTIIVFHKPKTTEDSPDELIVHRAIESEINPNNGMIYFETKGDASSGSGDPFDYDYRGENYTWHGKISENLVVGKVVLRIPWIGHVALFMRDSYGILVIIILMVILIIVEFIFPAFSREEKGKAEQEEDVEEPFET